MECVTFGAPRYRNQGIDRRVVRGRTAKGKALGPEIRFTPLGHPGMLPDLFIR